MQPKTDSKRLAYLAKYREANRERLRSYQKDWASNNREKERAKSARYLEKNKEWNAEKSQKRRARLKQVATFYVSKKELIRLYSNPCVKCGSKEQQTIDHIIPIKRGGRHSIGNMQTLCLSCNSKKNSRTMMEWKLNKKVAA